MKIKLNKKRVGSKHHSFFHRWSTIIFLLIFVGVALFMGAALIFKKEYEENLILKVDSLKLEEVENQQEWGDSWNLYQWKVKNTDSKEYFLAGLIKVPLSGPYGEEKTDLKTLVPPLELNSTYECIHHRVTVFFIQFQSYLSSCNSINENDNSS